MKYRLNDNAPPIEWIIDTDLSTADITATYTKSNGDVVASLCAKSTETATRFGSLITVTRVTHSWSDGDLDTMGIGNLKLSFDDGISHGSIHPIAGFQILVVP